MKKENNKRPKRWTWMASALSDVAFFLKHEECEYRQMLGHALVSYAEAVRKMEFTDSKEAPPHIERWAIMSAIAINPGGSILHYERIEDCTRRFLKELEGIISPVEE